MKNPKLFNIISTLYLLILWFLPLQLLSIDKFFHYLQVLLDFFHLDIDASIFYFFIFLPLIILTLFIFFKKTIYFSKSVFFLIYIFIPYAIIFGLYLYVITHVSLGGLL